MAADGQEWGEEAAQMMGQMEKRLKNTLPLYGNKESMNLNSMVLTNIVGSPYFKEELINYKTFHEVIDEVYYKVDHVEPWEKNSRKLAGQVGMCAGVRGVAAGGIVSTAYCLLFKLFTLKLTRKQLNAMLNHVDSPYIRALGFMYIRYCQPPADFWDWFEPYISDPEEIDLKAGGGYKVTIGEMCRMMLTKLDWFGTLFPRLPVSVMKDLDQKIKQVKSASRENEVSNSGTGEQPTAAADDEWGEAGRLARSAEAKRSRSPQQRRRSRSRSRERRRSREKRERSRSRDRERRRSRSRSRGRRRSRSRERSRRSRSRERRGHRSRSRERKRSGSRERRRSRSRDTRRRSRSRERKRGSSRERRRSRSRDRERSRRSSSKDRKHRRRSNSRDRD